MKVLQKEKDLEVNNNDKTGERFYQDEENIHENEATLFDTENVGEEEKTMIQDIWDLMKGNSEIELRGFNKVGRCVLAAWSRKINRYRNWKYYRYKYFDKSSSSLCRKKDWP